MASNRKITDNQFAPSTSIDSNVIDQALENAFDAQNNIEQIDGSWTPVNYVAHWSPARSYWRAQPETANAPMTSQTRRSPVTYGGTYEHYFPFLNSRNWNDETYPRTRSDDNSDLKNEYRHKGFAYEKTLGRENWCRGLSYINQSPSSITPVASGPGTSYPSTRDDILPGATENGLSSMGDMSGVGVVTATTRFSPQANKYMASEMSYYFSEPVILSSINVVAAQEHPISYYSSGYSVPLNSYFPPGAGGLGFKVSPPTATQYDNSSQYCINAGQYIETTTAAIGPPAVMNMNQTGAEFFGAHNMSLIGGDPPFVSTVPSPYGGRISVQILIDNEFNSEVRQLTNVAYQIRRVQEESMFNMQFPTSNSTDHPAPASVGQSYFDMKPRYPGGATWGLFITEQNLNIPIPRDSRVRFAIICRGFQATQAFEWNSNLTVLERVEE
tara:strand:- start:2061 stop:3386 length:1326 start_codon:yes stop_codon:yes gene_type:complete